MAALTAALALALAPAPAHADLADVLAPGSRAAPGLGGDPFASPLHDAPGWWSREAPQPGRSQRAWFESSLPLLGSAQAGVDLRRSEWRGVASETRSLGMRPWTIAVARRDPAWHSSAGGGATRVEGSGADAGLGIGARVDEALPGLSLAATVPAWSARSPAQPAPLGAGLRFDGRGWLASQIAWTRERSEPGVHARGGGREVLASTALRRDDVAADLEARAGVVAAELSLRRSWIAPEAAAGSGFSLAPQGLGTEWQSGLVLRPVSGWRLLLRRTEGRGDASGSGTFEGLRFARLSYLRGRLGSWLGAGEWRAGPRRVLAEVEHYRFEGGGRGTIEAWPFTGALADFLAARRNFLASGEVAAWRLHAAAELGRPGRTRWRAGVAGYDLETHAKLIGWQPTFLAFGVSDRTEDLLGVRRLQLGAISGGATFRVASFEVDADARQFVFAKVFRTPTGGTVTPETASGTSAGGATPSTRARGWPGGTSFSLGVRHAW